MNDDDDDEEKMDEENHDAYRNYVIDDEARNDPNYFKCSVISNGIRYTNNFVDKCSNNNCIYSNEPLCANCLRKHKHVFE